MEDLVDQNVDEMKVCSNRPSQHYPDIIATTAGKILTFPSYTTQEVLRYNILCAELEPLLVVDRQKGLPGALPILEP